MTVKNILKEPFSHTDVEGIVLEVVNAGESDNLKIIVTQKVIDVIGLTDENLPERVKSWIHQICLPYTAGISPKKFTGKLADSIDLVSLPNRKRL